MGLPTKIRKESDPIASVWETGAVNRRGDKLTRFDELFDLVKAADLAGTGLNIRMIGPSFILHSHGADIKLDKPSERSGKDLIWISKPCLKSPGGNDPCPYCAAGIPLQTKVASNVIVRKLQKSMRASVMGQRQPSEKKRQHAWNDPDKTSSPVYFLRDPKSTLETPVRVLLMPTTVVAPIMKICKMRAANSPSGKVYGPEHDERGFDINISYDKDAAAANAYSVMMSSSKATPLTEAEMKIPLWDIASYPKDDFKTAEKDAIDWRKKAFFKKGDKKGVGYMFPEDRDPPKADKPAQKAMEFDDEVSVDDDYDEPKAKVKVKAKKTARGEEDDYDEPRPAKTKTKKGVVAKKVSPPKKSSAPLKARPSTSKKASAKVPVKASAKKTSTKTNRR